MTDLLPEQMPSSSDTYPEHVSEPVVPHTETADRPAPGHGTSDLENLLNGGACRVKEELALIHHGTGEPAPYFQAPASTAVGPCMGVAPPGAPNVAKHSIRHGKIARLPKPERDMVNKLLYNHVSYKKIGWALAERGITVTERNISNWRTRGGYKEWCDEQENQIRLSQIQDHLTDYLRKNDAQQIPEVGLQVAATQLTCQLINPQTSRELLADPTKYREIVDMLAKCSGQLAELQKNRNESFRNANIKNTPANILWEENRDVEWVREIASADLIAESSHDVHIPHRNDLPPREMVPIAKPGPTFGEMLGITKRVPDNRHFHIENAHAVNLDGTRPPEKEKPKAVPASPAPAPTATTPHDAPAEASAPAPVPGGDDGNNG